MALEQRSYQTSYVRELEIPENPKKQPQVRPSRKSFFQRGEVLIRAVFRYPRPFLNNDSTYTSTNQRNKS